MTNISDCTSCAASTYQNAVGMDHCLPCSSSSTSLVGADSCTCTGKNRVFQAGNGWCICKPGYEFVDLNLNLLSEADGDQDCQPAVYDRCDDGTYRTPTTGECVEEDLYCVEVCGELGGEMSPLLGTCQCYNITTLAEACDSDCRAQLATVMCNSDGEMALSDPVTGEEFVIDFADMGAEGSVDCSTLGASVVSMSTTSGEFAGVFGTNSAVSSAAEAGRRRLLGIARYSDEMEDEEYHTQTQTQTQVSLEEDLARATHASPTMAPATAAAATKDPHWSLGTLAAAVLKTTHLSASVEKEKGGVKSSAKVEREEEHAQAGRDRERPVAPDARRRLNSYSADMVAFSTPIVCMALGSTIVWDVDNDNYPVYIKDSLLNTNEAFDYTDFRKVGSSNPHTSLTRSVLTTHSFPHSTIPFLPSAWRYL
jgi:hypothetical protein